MNFKSLIELLDYFKEEKTCIEYYEQLRWNGRTVCPHCGVDSVPYRTNRGYKCSDKDCHKKFTVKVGTIFENSKIPLRTWFAAIYLCTAHKKGISSLQLGRDLNITQKTAWFVLHRVREMLKAQAPTMLDGNMVEADETYIGGLEGNKHANKRRKEGEPDKKKIVLGVIERDGRVILKYIPNATEQNMVPFIEQYVPEGSRVITDEFVSYNKLDRRYVHQTINHTLKIYVTGDIHTNTIENFWSVLKRGLYGIYHSVSEKHLDRYLHEFSSRFNTRKITEHARFEKFLAQSEKRLKYKNLIA